MAIKCSRPKCKKEVPKNSPWILEEVEVETKEGASEDYTFSFCSERCLKIAHKEFQKYDDRWADEFKLQFPEVDF